MSNLAILGAFDSGMQTVSFGKGTNFEAPSLVFFKTLL
jgi:hypothetical protein